MTVKYKSRNDGGQVPIVAMNNEGSVPKPFFRFADLNGDGTGIYDLTGDYSVTPAIAFVQPAVGQILRIARMVVFIRDGGSFDVEGYGNMNALTNGITVRVQNDSETLYNLTSQETIITNVGWGTYSYDIAVSTFGSGDEAMLCRWTFEKAGFPIRLIGDNNERLEYVLNDDFRNLVHHAFHIQGYWEKQ